ncbi:unnamed protein product [Arctogadus glacialis]
MRPDQRTLPRHGTLAVGYLCCCAVSALDSVVALLYKSSSEAPSCHSTLQPVWFVFPDTTAGLNRRDPVPSAPQRAAGPPRPRTMGSGPGTMGSGPGTMDGVAELLNRIMREIGPAESTEMQRQTKALDCGLLFPECRGPGGDGECIPTHSVLSRRFDQTFLPLLFLL